jgi:hypothetical protein
MNQTQRILELVKGGSITVEQGMELLKALEGTDRPAPPESPRPPRPPRPPQPAWKESVSTAKRTGRPLGSGGGQLSFDQIVQLGMYNIKPEFVQEMRDAGLDDINFDTVVQLGMYGIKPAYVLEIRQIAEEMGAPMPSTEKIIELGMYGVKPGYVRDMMKTGMVSLDAFNEESDAERLEAKRAKLEAKRDKLQARTNKPKTEKERERLEKMLEEVNDELEGISEELGDLLEAQLEAELEANDVDPHNSKSGRHEPRFTSEVLVDPNLPAEMRRDQLEEQLRDAKAAQGIAQSDEEREALREVQRLITAELEKVYTELQR